MSEVPQTRRSQRLAFDAAAASTVEARREAAATSAAAAGPEEKAADTTTTTTRALRKNTAARVAEPVAVKAQAASTVAVKASAAPKNVKEALVRIKNRITESQDNLSYYNSLDMIISSIVTLMTEWPQLTLLAGNDDRVRVDTSTEISTIFLNVIQDWLGSTREYVRPTLLLGLDTDAECNKAQQNARAIAGNNPQTYANSDSPVINYTISAKRARGEPADGSAMTSVTWGKGDYKDMGIYRPSADPKIDQFVTAANKDWIQEKNKLGTTVERGNCGNCWLCSQPVYFYKSIKGFTGCGQCEHMGAIIGTIISYMTANLANNNNSAYGYATSHTWCNQVKSDTLPMRFTADGVWILDEVGVRDIAQKIMGIGINSPWNYQEYDPLQWKRIYEWRDINREITTGPGLRAYNKIVKSISDGTNLWCTKANENLTSLILPQSNTSAIPSEGANLIQQLTRIITYVIEDTTERAIDLNVGVWGPGKNGGSIGNIYPESVSSSEKITDKNIYKDINKKIDEKSDEKGDKKSDIIDLNNIYNRALGVTIKNKEDLIKVIYDVLTKLYENKNGTYVPMFNKLLTNLKNSLIEKNKSNSKNTIEKSEKKYDTSIRDLKVDNNSYVNPINTNNNVLVESRGGKRNTKKRNTKKRNTKKRNTRKRNTRKRNNRKRNTRKRNNRK
jgi:hypothetical protein